MKIRAFHFLLRSPFTIFATKYCRNAHRCIIGTLQEQRHSIHEMLLRKALSN
ncbi:MAG: hypothetical protein IJZ92_07530 [Bacteroidaceae bacterium]|nr:hypothetical protein [Bacteroidaceae bacterium]